MPAQAFTPQNLTMSGGRTIGSIAAEISRLGLRMFGCTTAAVGTPPKIGAETEWKIQGGYISHASPVSVVFPHAFPKGLVGVFLGSKSSAAYVSAMSLTGFTVTIPSGTTAFCWFALGW